MVEDCVFCRIAAGKLPAQIVSATHSWLAVRDVNPQAPTHIVVFPKEHLPRLTKNNASGGRVYYPADVALLNIAAEAAHQAGLDDYRIIINNGPGAGQQVQHLHPHILGGWEPGQSPALVGAAPERSPS